MSDLVIETKKLTKIYGEQTAVNSVNLHVKPGRIYGLLGRNAFIPVLGPSSKLPVFIRI